MRMAVPQPLLPAQFLAGHGSHIGPPLPQVQGQPWRPDVHGPAGYVHPPAGPGQPSPQESAAPPSQTYVAGVGGSPQPAAAQTPATPQFTQSEAATLAWQHAFQATGTPPPTPFF